MDHSGEYFKVVYADFQAKATILADLVKDHPGEHGGVIENAVSELLKSVLPSSCAIGSGFVIDSEGGRSQQCDIVIYDTQSSFNLFGYWGRFLFPVESVHAVVEVKKTLDMRQVRDACQKIASVRRLKYISEPTPYFKNDGEGGLDVCVRQPTPPHGIIIGYQSNTSNLETIKNWFSKAFLDISDSTHHLDMAVSVREGFKVRYFDIEHSRHKLGYQFYPLEARDKAGNRLQDSEGRGGYIYLPKREWKPGKTIPIGTYDGYPYNRECKLVSHPDHPTNSYPADDARLLDCARQYFLAFR